MMFKSMDEAIIIKVNWMSSIFVFANLAWPLNLTEFYGGKLSEIISKQKEPIWLKGRYISYIVKALSSKVALKKSQEHKYHEVS